jgi:hypothetical protein
MSNSEYCVQLTASQHKKKWVIKCRTFCINSVPELTLSVLYCACWEKIKSQVDAEMCTTLLSPLA